MIRLLRITAVFCIVVASCTADASDYYSAYTLYPQKGYDASTFYYKPNPAAPSYRYHYLIHYAGERFVYYYNPDTRLFWGCYDLEGKGFSLLDIKDQRGKLTEIPAAAFPAVAPNAANPESGNPIPPPPDPPTRPRLGK